MYRKKWVMLYGFCGELGRVPAKASRKSLSLRMAFTGLLDVTQDGRQIEHGVGT